MPEKLNDEKDWDSWEQELLNMLQILIGVHEIPLVYIVWENEEKPMKSYDSFEEECIAKASISWVYFVANAKHVHEIIQALTIIQNAE